jgi:hypothetical protein
VQTIRVLRIGDPDLAFEEAYKIGVNSRKQKHGQKAERQKLHSGVSSSEYWLSVRIPIMP